MDITKIKYYDIGKSNDSIYLGKCSVVLEESIILNDIRIFNGKKGRYIVMPRKENLKNDSSCGDSSMIEKYKDVFHPVRKSFYSFLSRVILRGYDNMLKTGETIYFPKK